MHTSHIPSKALKISGIKDKKNRASSRGNSKDYRTGPRIKPVFKMVRRHPTARRKNNQNKKKKIKKGDNSDFELDQNSKVKRVDYQSNALRYSNVDPLAGSKLMSLPQSKKLLFKRKKGREKKTRGKSAAYQDSKF